MARIGRVKLEIVIEEAKIDATKAKIIAAVKTLVQNRDATSASGTLAYEQIPENLNF